MKLTIDLPESVFSAIRKSPDEFVKEMRLAAAMKWYELEMISQAKAAEIAGISRNEFLKQLARFQVSPFQYSVGEIVEELEDNH